MKKSLIYFIAGFISGVISLFIVAVCISKSNNGMTFFDEPGECWNTNSIKIFQVIDKSAALAVAIEIIPDNSSDIIISRIEEQKVLLINREGKFYYDEQVIDISENQHVRQIGIYKYPTKSDIERTVPIVEIMDK